MGAAERLGDDAVDDLRDRSRSCAVIFMLVAASLARRGIAPQDRGRTLGRDHRIDRVLQHVDAVGGGDRDRAARAAFADDHRRSIGTSSARQAAVERAMASAWPRSSAPMPG